MQTLLILTRMLQEDKQLFQLYNDLVVSGVITAEEFWSNRMQVGVASHIITEVYVQQCSIVIQHLFRQLLSLPMYELLFYLQTSKHVTLSQHIGVSPSFLSEIKPTSQGSNSISYNLTTDMIDSIFKTYPQGRTYNTLYPTLVCLVFTFKVLLGNVKNPIYSTFYLFQ